MFDKLKRIFSPKADAQEPGKVLAFGEFLELVKSRLEKRHPRWKIEVAEDSSISSRPYLKLEGAPAVGSLGLSNSYLKYLNSPKTLEAVVGTLLSMAEQPGAGTPALSEVRAKIFPTPKPAGFGSDPKLETAKLAFAPDLIKAYFIDLGDTVRYVNLSTLKKWGLTLSQLDAIAMENQRAIPLGGMVSNIVKGKKGGSATFLGINGNDYLASMVFFPDQLFSLAKNQGLAEDEFIISFPARNHISLFGSSLPLTLAYSWTAAQYASSPCKISENIYLLKKSGKLALLDPFEVFFETPQGEVKPLEKTPASHGKKTSKGRS